MSATYQDSELDAPSHPVVIGYVFWLLGFLGAHRFYFGKPLTGALWFFTGGLCLVGWIVDLFLIPDMAMQANQRFPIRQTDYSVAWLLLIFLGFFGVHRFYMGKFLTGAIYLLTGGLFGIGYVYDVLTLNEQIVESAR
ncbi:MAG: TM2 domain-containing protein [Planctomycetota bacterium]